MTRCSMVFILVATGLVTALAAAPSVAPQASSGHAVGYTVKTWPLPDNGAGDVSMDYIAYDPSTNSVWVPGGVSGAIDVVDAASGTVRQIKAPTSRVDIRGTTRTLGPTAVSIGSGVVYIGNRGDSSVCTFDARTLKPGACGHLDSVPDGVVYVAPTQEVWVTTPRDKSIRILDAKTLEQKGKLTFDGNPEGYAVDATRSRFYTNLEDKDRTLAIDLKTHKTVATWQPSCGEEGPHGLGLDAAAGHLFVACSTLAEVLDVGHDGRILSKIDTGDGVDDINYVPATHMLYVGAAKAARLTMARADQSGHLTVVTQVSTPAGTRNAVAGRNGTVFLAHGGRTKLSALVVISARS